MKMVGRILLLSLILIEIIIVRVCETVSFEGNSNGHCFGPLEKESLQSSHCTYMQTNNLFIIHLITLVRNSRELFLFCFKNCLK